MLSFVTPLAPNYLLYQRLGQAIRDLANRQLDVPCSLSSGRFDKPTPENLNGNRVVERGERGETLYVNPWYVATLG
ncbi:MAG: hypothetical protein P8163_22880, partial [Candidatus Thiodiazotropha sp.]